MADNRAYELAKSCAAQLMADMAAFNAEEDDDQKDELRTDLIESSYGIQVRSDWYTPGEESPTPGEFAITLAGGGPALRLRGELDSGEPYDATLEYQDWGTPWTPYRPAPGEANALLDFARLFYFGEG